ncbi:MAG: class I SAM-dependent methyltransferase [Cyclobacteriaceae bacterium]
MNKRANAQLSLIRDYIDIEGSTIVDLGCGFGNFLSAIKGYCNKSYGLEYDDLAIKHCKQQELDVRKIHDESEIANIDPCKLVVLSHVLEHLRSIDTTLESLKSSSEYVFIEIPSYNRSIAEQYVDQEGHLNFFTKKSASMLFDKLGFEIIHLDSYGPNIKLFWKENWFFNIIKRQFRSASKDFFMNKYHSKSNNGIWIRSILKVKSNH